MTVTQHRWLVTGSSGLLGSYALNYLSRTRQVTGVSRTRLAREAPNQESFVGDLSDEAFVSRLMDQVRPTHVLHAAGLVGHEVCSDYPDQAYRSNVLTTRYVARHSDRVGASLIFVSTDSVYGSQHGWHSESEEVQPFSLYGETKLAGERETDAHSAAIIVRTNFFGWPPSGGASILTFFLDALSADKAVVGFDDFVVSSMYVSDLLETLVRLTELGVHGTFNVGSRDALSKYEFGRTVAQVFGFDASLIERRSASDMASLGTSRVRDLSLNLGKLESVLGRSTPTQRESLHQARSDRGGEREVELV